MATRLATEDSVEEEIWSESGFSLFTLSNAWPDSSVRSYAPYWDAPSCGMRGERSQHPWPRLPMFCQATIPMMLRKPSIVIVDRSGPAEPVPAAERDQPNDFCLFTPHL